MIEQTKGHSWNIIQRNLQIRPSFNRYINKDIHRFMNYYYISWHNYHLFSCEAFIRGIEYDRGGDDFLHKLRVFRVEAP